MVVWNTNFRAIEILEYAYSKQFWYNQCHLLLIGSKVFFTRDSKSSDRVIFWFSRTKSQRVDGHSTKIAKYMKTIIMALLCKLLGVIIHFVWNPTNSKSKRLNKWKNSKFFSTIKKGKYWNKILQFVCWACWDAAVSWKFSVLHQVQ